GNDGRRVTAICDTARNPLVPPDERQRVGTNGTPRKLLPPPAKAVTQRPRQSDTRIDHAEVGVVVEPAIAPRTEEQDARVTVAFCAHEPSPCKSRMNSSAVTCQVKASATSTFGAGVTPCSQMCGSPWSLTIPQSGQPG